MKFGMPLKPEHKRFAVQPNRLNHAIVTARCLDTQSAPERLDRLVVDRDHAGRLRPRIKPGQTGVLAPGNGVRMAVVIVMYVRHRVLDLGHDVLVQGSAQCDVDQLCPAADA